MSEKRNESGFVFRLKVPTRNAAARSSLEKGSRQDTAKNFQSWGIQKFVTRKLVLLPKDMRWVPEARGLEII
jgi:hypothetical protein